MVMVMGWSARALPSRLPDIPCRSALGRDRLYRQSWSRPSAFLRGQFRSCRGGPHLPAVLGACRRQQRHAVIGVARGVDGFAVVFLDVGLGRSEEHTSELQSLMRISYAVFCLKKKKYQ